MNEKIVIDKNDLRLLYETQGESTKEIAKLYNTTPKTIRLRLHKYNIPVRTSGEENRKLNVNENYFKDIDTSNKAYVLGLISADGYIGNNRFDNGITLGITLKQDDSYILDFIKKDMQATYKIKIKNKNYYEFYVCSNIICNTLQKYGIIQNKSLILDIKDVITKANIKQNLIPSFLLGYYDGDGCIYQWVSKDGKREQYNINITGTKETCDYFYDFFDNRGFFTKRHKNENNNYTYVVSGRNLVVNSLDKLYSTIYIPDVFLARKYSKYLLAKSPTKGKALS
ncbi:MAG: hypothetical protein PHT02_00535 [Tissierellia bacterium]|nr:hypothetical protein [Tissierellia bacterium]